MYRHVLVDTSWSCLSWEASWAKCSNLYTSSLFKGSWKLYGPLLSRNHVSQKFPFMTFFFPPCCSLYLLSRLLVTFFLEEFKFLCFEKAKWIKQQKIRTPARTSDITGITDGNFQQKNFPYHLNFFNLVLHSLERVLKEDQAKGEKGVVLVAELFKIRSCISIRR